MAERGDAGEDLATLNGDTRPGVGLLPVAEGAGERALPGHQFCYIPPGPFWLGSIEGEDDLADDDEYGHREPFHLDYAYWISRYPVTNVQYRAFVDDDGYTEQWRRCWTEAGWQWKRDRIGPDR